MFTASITIVIWFSIVLTFRQSSKTPLLISFHNMKNYLAASLGFFLLSDLKQGSETLTSTPSLLQGPPYHDGHRSGARQALCRKTKSRSFSHACHGTIGTTHHLFLRVVLRDLVDTLSVAPHPLKTLSWWFRIVGKSPNLLLSENSICAIFANFYGTATENKKYRQGILVFFELYAFIILTSSLVLGILVCLLEVYWKWPFCLQ